MESKPVDDFDVASRGDILTGGSLTDRVWAKSTLADTQGLVLLSQPHQFSEFSSTNGTDALAHRSPLFSSGGFAALAFHDAALISQRESLLFPGSDWLSQEATRRSDGWSCDLCTFSNDLGSNACEMCGTVAEGIPRIIPLLPPQVPQLLSLTGEGTDSAWADKSATISGAAEDSKSATISGAAEVIEKGNADKGGGDDSDGDNAADAVAEASTDGAAGSSLTEPLATGAAQESSDELASLSRSPLDVRLYCRGFQESASLQVLVRTVDRSLCRALGSPTGASHVRGALPHGSVPAAFLVFYSPQLATAALELDDAIFFCGHKLTLRRPQGYARDLADPLLPLRVTIDRENSLRAPAAPNAPTARSKLALRHSAMTETRGSKVREESPSSTKVKSGGTTSTSSSKASHGFAPLVTYDQMTSLSPEARARVSRVRLQLKRESLEALDALCAREKGGMMCVFYAPLLKVLEAFQKEGFLTFSPRGTHTLIFSGVAGEAAHNVPKPRRPTDGINSFTLQFVRRLILDQGFPLRAFLG